MSNEVQNPIINSPFVEPKLHWQIEHGKSPVKAEGRRPASYYYRVPESAGRGRKNKKQLTLQASLSESALDFLKKARNT
jgi:type III restriction enzyme